MDIRNTSQGLFDQSSLPASPLPDLPAPPLPPPGLRDAPSSSHPTRAGIVPLALLAGSAALPTGHAPDVHREAAASSAV
jgi:hypothetical protein